MRRPLKGFSLVELLTVIIIFALLLVAIFAVLAAGRRSWQIGSAQIQVQQEARRAMDSMIQELRGASAIDPSTFVNGVSNDVIRFTAGGQNLEFSLNVLGFNAGQLIRTEGATTTVLANNIQNIQFNLSGGNVVYITLTTQGTSIFGHPVQAAFNSQVVLRN